MSLDIFKALEHENTTKVLKILDIHPDFIYESERYGSYIRNLLNAAIGKNNTIVVKKLLELGCESVGYGNTSDIHLAASKGNYEIFNLLLNYGLDPFINEKVKHQTLKFNIVGNGCACGEIKHDHGPKIFTVNESFINPILHRAVYGKNLLIIDKLIQLGCDINGEDDCGKTALIVACEENNIDIVKYLVSKKANVNYVTKMEKPLLNYSGYKTFKHTALRVAAHHKHYEIVKFLLNNGAHIDDFEIIDFDKDLDIYMLLYGTTYFKLNDVHRFAYLGDDCINKIENLDQEEVKKMVIKSHSIFKTPIHICIKKNNIILLNYLIEKYKIPIDKSMIEESIYSNNIFILKYLLEINNDFDLSEYVKNIIENENLEMLKYVCDYTKINFSYKQGEILDAAWKKCNLDIMKFILDKGGNPNTKFWTGGTLLFDHYCFCKKNIHNLRTMTKLLLDYGLDTSIKNNDNKTIYDYLIKRLDDGFFFNNETEIFLALLSIKNNQFDKNKIKSIVQKYKNKYTLDIVYNHAPSRCPADDMNIERNNNMNFLINFLKNYIDKESKEEIMECSICMDNLADFKDAPCGHIVICESCSSKVNKCPQCLTHFVD